MDLKNRPGINLRKNEREFLEINILIEFLSNFSHTNATLCDVY